MQLNDTINYYFSVFEKKNLFRLFPNLKNELIKQYFQIIEISAISRNIDIIEEYFQVIETGINDDFYEVSWSISKIKKIISEKQIPLFKFNINEIYSDDNNLIEIKSHYYKDIKELNFNPIFVSYYQPINSYIVVDGNHRVNEVKKRGGKEINGFYLSPYYNKIVMNNFSFSLYTFHHNLVCLYQLCKNKKIWNFKTNKSLDKNTFYGDNVEFKNLKLKKIIILLS